MSYVTTQDLTAGSTVSQKLTQPETQQRKQLSTWVDLTSVRASCTPLQLPSVPLPPRQRKQNPSQQPARVSKTAGICLQA